MGLNIHLANFAGTTDEQTLPELDGRFDHIRYTGDRWFSDWAHDGHCVYRSLHVGLDVEVYYRPRDLEQARRWVSLHIGFGNKQRWFDLFALMQAEPDLWLQDCS